MSIYKYLTSYFKYLLCQEHQAEVLSLKRAILELKADNSKVKKLEVEVTELRAKILRTDDYIQRHRGMARRKGEHDGADENRENHAQYQSKAIFSEARECLGDIKIDIEHIHKKPVRQPQADSQVDAIVVNDSAWA